MKTFGKFLYRRGLLSLVIGVFITIIIAVIRSFISNAPAYEPYDLIVLGGATIVTMIVFIITKW